MDANAASERHRIAREIITTEAKDGSEQSFSDLLSHLQFDVFLNFNEIGRLGLHGMRPVDEVMLAAGIAYERLLR